MKLKKSTWKRWGRMSAKKELAVSNALMKQGIKELSDGKKIGITKLEKQGASKIHVAKMHYANAKSKQKYGSGVKKNISAGMGIFN